MINDSENIVTRSKGKTENRRAVIPLKARIVFLMLEEYQVAVEEKNMKEDGYDEEDEYDELDEDDEDEIERVLGISGETFVDATEFYGFDDEDWDEDDDFEDPDAKNDPIYHIVVQVNDNTPSHDQDYVTNFLKSYGKADPNGIITIAKSYLNDIDRQVLQDILNN